MFLVTDDVNKITFFRVKVYTVSAADYFLYKDGCSTREIEFNLIPIAFKALCGNLCCQTTGFWKGVLF